jgi:hypothetical protein
MYSSVVIGTKIALALRESRTRTAVSDEAKTAATDDKAALRKTGAAAAR